MDRLCNMTALDDTVHDPRADVGGAGLPATVHKVRSFHLT